MPRLNTLKGISRRQSRVTDTAAAAPLAGNARAEPARFSRTEWLANIIRERILDGTYQPGERIREVQLRTEFGFSNGPIRESLQAIVADGLAERAPWQGVRVKTLSERELIELFQVRLALLEYASELAAQNVDPQLRETGAALKRELRSAFKEFDKSGRHPSPCNRSGTKPCSRRSFT
jgi:DNA-binding GntR family transcriptional regulator